MAPGPVAVHGPKAQVRHPGGRVEEIANFGRVVEAKHLGLDVVDADHGNYPDLGILVPGGLDLGPGGFRGLDHVVAHPALRVRRGAVAKVHGHASPGIDRDLVGLGVFHERDPVRGQTGRENGEAVAYLEVGILGGEDGQRLVAAIDRFGVGDGAPLDVHVHLAERVQIDHLGVRVHERVHVADGHGELRPVGPSETDGHVPPAGSDAPNLVQHELGVQRGGPAPRGVAVPVGGHERQGKVFQARFLGVFGQTGDGKRARVHVRGDVFRAPIAARLFGGVVADHGEDLLELDVRGHRLDAAEPEGLGFPRLDDAIVVLRDHLHRRSRPRDIAVRKPRELFGAFEGHGPVEDVVRVFVLDGELAVVPAPPVRFLGDGRADVGGFDRRG